MESSGMQLPVRCNQWQDLINFSRINIGAGGMFVPTATPLPVATKLTVQLVVVCADQVIDIPAQISRVRMAEDKQSASTGPGMSVTFNISKELRNRIESLVAIGKSHLERQKSDTGEALEAVHRKDATYPRGTGLSAETLFDSVAEGCTGKVCISPEVQIAAVRRHLQDGQYVNAREELRSLFAGDPHHSQGRLLWLLSEAKEFAEAGRSAEAKAKYLQILQLDNGNSEAQAGLAELDPKRRSLW